MTANKYNKMPQFSVLISIYRKEQAEYLRASLNSVFAQTVSPSEVVLVKDGPLTEELELVLSDFSEKHPELKTVSLPRNVGLGQALNEGLKHCSHELVARMDTDDICKPNRFERQLQAFTERPDIDVCSSWIDEFEDDKERVTGQRRLPEEHEDIVPFAKSRSPVNHAVAMYKKSKVTAAGGYYGFPEDSHLWVRLLMKGARFHNLQESLLWVRTSADMFQRRGGWQYLNKDLHSQWTFYRIGFLSLPAFLKNVCIRVPVRMMPNILRTWIYKNCLRTKN